MNPRMCPSRATVWRRIPDGRAVGWERAEIPCRWDEVRETLAGASGDTASWHAEIIVPAASDTEPFTKKDRIALGSRSEPEPTADALSVTEVHPVHLGGARPHHWEAEAR